MVAASIMSIVLLNSGLSIPELFLVVAGLNVIVSVYIYSLLPEFMMRFLAWVLINIVYRIRVTGLEKIPTSGPAVVVCNHVSYMDPVILTGSIRRPMRFVMYYRIFPDSTAALFFRTHAGNPDSGQDGRRTAHERGVRAS